MTHTEKDLLFLAKTSELPIGEIKRCPRENPLPDILLAHVDKQFYAVDDLCPHEDVPLSTGCLYDHVIKCSLHGSRFDLRTGQVQNDPAEDNIKTHRLHIDADNIFLIL
jgi:3-phenylpropionate/trans-cinnamate dioxygenase ferredoxin component